MLLRRRYYDYENCFFALLLVIEIVSLHMIVNTSEDAGCPKKSYQQNAAGDTVHMHRPNHQ